MHPLGTTTRLCRIW